MPETGLTSLAFYIICVTSTDWVNEMLDMIDCFVDLAQAVQIVVRPIHHSKFMPWAECGAG